MQPALQVSCTTTFVNAGNAGARRCQIQALDVVQAMVVELFEQWLEGAPDIGEVHDPAAFRSRLPGDVHLDAEGVAVQACTLVSGWHVGEPVRGLDLEHPKNIHEPIVPPRLW